MRISDWSSDVCSSDLIFEGQLHSFPQPHTGFIQAADVIPTHIGHLHHHFTHGRRLNALQCIKEILPRYAQLVEHLGRNRRSEEHTSELQSLMRISYAVFCLKKKKQYTKTY